MEDSKRKGIAALIVDRIDAPKEEEKESPESEDSSSDLELIAGDVIAAVESGDVSGLADALKSFVKSCKYEKSGEGEEE